MPVRGWGLFAAAAPEAAPARPGSEGRVCPCCPQGVRPGARLGKGRVPVPVLGVGGPLLRLRVLPGRVWVAVGASLRFLRELLVCGI